MKDETTGRPAGKRKKRRAALLLTAVFLLSACGGAAPSGVPDSLAAAGVYEMSYEWEGETFSLVCEAQEGDDFLTRDATLTYTSPASVAGLTIRRAAGRTEVCGGTLPVGEGASALLWPLSALCLSGAVRSGAVRRGDETEATYLRPDGTVETLAWRDGDERPRRIVWESGSGRVCAAPAGGET